ncbi:MAG TPA: biliverdin-producing heme oxygenase [Kofleriaceae bacterium]
MIEGIIAATSSLDEALATESRALVQTATPEAYRQYLARLFGFIAPLERSLAKFPDLRSAVDTRRFDKHELLRRDLEALNTRASELVCCSEIPIFNDVQTALGWAYVMERSSLGHTALFQALASLMPREAAFAASYVKCYFGAIGESWRNFVEALDAAATSELETTRIIAAAQDASSAYVAWSRVPLHALVHRAAIRLVR